MVPGVLGHGEVAMTIWGLPVAGWMTAPAITLDGGCSLADAQRLMERHGVHHLPVLAGGALAGMVTLRAIHALQPHAAPLSAREWRALLATARLDAWLDAGWCLVAPHEPLGTVARALAERALSAATVAVDRRPLGVITVGDVSAAALAGRLPAGRAARRCALQCAGCGATTHVRQEVLAPPSCWRCGAGLAAPHAISQPPDDCRVAQESGARS